MYIFFVPAESRGWSEAGVKWLKHAAAGQEKGMVQQPQARPGFGLGYGIGNLLC